MKTTAAVTISRSLASSLVALVGMSVGLGCAPVTNMDRGRLAHPTMAAADMTGYAEAHIRSINEGSTGGSGGAGSGCGCN